MNDIPTVVDLLTRGGLLTALIIALIGGMRGWYIWGTQHKEILASAEKSHADAIAEKNEQLDDMKEDRDYWRNQARTALSGTVRAVGVVEASSRKQE